MQLLLLLLQLLSILSPGVNGLKEKFTVGNAVVYMPDWFGFQRDATITKVIGDGTYEILYYNGTKFVVPGISLIPRQPWGFYSIGDMVIAPMETEVSVCTGEPGGCVWAQGVGNASLTVVGIDLTITPRVYSLLAFAETGTLDSQSFSATASSMLPLQQACSRIFCPPGRRRIEAPAEVWFETWLSQAEVNSVCCPEVPAPAPCQGKEVIRPVVIGHCSIGPDKSIMSVSYPEPYPGGLPGQCEIKPPVPVSVSVSTFRTQYLFDGLVLNGTAHSGGGLTYWTSAPLDGAVTQSVITWAPDLVTARSGWKISLCAEKHQARAPVTTTTTTTTTGTTYLVNSSIVAFVTGDGCILTGTTLTSQSFPLNYNNSDFCNVTLLPNVMVQVQVQYFDTEFCCDVMTVNSLPFSGFGDGLHGTTATGSLTWQADGSATRAGWSIRLVPVAWPTPGAWKLLVHQDLTQCLFTAAQGKAFLLNENDPSQPCYMALGNQDWDSLRGADQKLLFRIVWTRATGEVYESVFKQASLPHSSPVQGFEAVNAVALADSNSDEQGCWTFGGLQLTVPPGDELIHGSIVPSCSSYVIGAINDLGTNLAAASPSYSTLRESTYPDSYAYSYSLFVYKAAASAVAPKSRRADTVTATAVTPLEYNAYQVQSGNCTVDVQGCVNSPPVPQNQACRILAPYMSRTQVMSFASDTEGIMTTDGLNFRGTGRGLTGRVAKTLNWLSESSQVSSWRICALQANDYIVQGNFILSLSSDNTITGQPIKAFVKAMAGLAGVPTNWVSVSATVANTATARQYRQYSNVYTLSYSIAVPMSSGQADSISQSLNQLTKPQLQAGLRDALLKDNILSGFILTVVTTTLPSVLTTTTTVSTTTSTQIVSDPSAALAALRLRAIGISIGVISVYLTLLGCLYVSSRVRRTKLGHRSVIEIVFGVWAVPIVLIIWPLIPCVLLYLARVRGRYNAQRRAFEAEMRQVGALAQAFASKADDLEAAFQVPNQVNALEAPAQSDLVQQVLEAEGTAAAAVAEARRTLDLQLLKLQQADEDAEKEMETVIRKAQQEQPGPAVFLETVLEYTFQQLEGYGAQPSTAEKLARSKASSEHKAFEDCVEQLRDREEALKVASRRTEQEKEAELQLLKEAAQVFDSDGGTRRSGLVEYWCTLDATWKEGQLVGEGPSGSSACYLYNREPFMEFKVLDASGSIQTIPLDRLRLPLQEGEQVEVELTSVGPGNWVPGKLLAIRHGPESELLYQVKLHVVQADVIALARNIRRRIPAGRQLYVWLPSQGGWVFGEVQPPTKGDASPLLATAPASATPATRSNRSSAQKGPSWPTLQVKLSLERDEELKVDTDSTIQVAAYAIRTEVVRHMHRQKTGLAHSALFQDADGSPGASS